MYLRMQRREIVMGLDVEGDAAVADGTESRFDILPAREVLLSALRQVPDSPRPRGEQTGRQAKSASLPALMPFPSGGDNRSSASRFVPTAKDAEPTILRCAETLSIPWKQIVVDEIEAEQKLRRYIADVENECPLHSA